MKRKYVTRALALGLCAGMLAGSAAGCGKKADPEVPEEGSVEAAEGDTGEEEDSGPEAAPLPDGYAITGQGTVINNAYLSGDAGDGYEAEPLFLGIEGEPVVKVTNPSYLRPVYFADEAGEPLDMYTPGTLGYSLSLSGDTSGFASFHVSPSEGDAFADILERAKGTYQADQEAYGTSLVFADRELADGKGFLSLSCMDDETMRAGNVQVQYCMDVGRDGWYLEGMATLYVPYHMNDFIQNEKAVNDCFDEALSYLEFDVSDYEEIAASADAAPEDSGMESEEDGVVVIDDAEE